MHRDFVLPGKCGQSLSIGCLNLQNFEMHWTTCVLNVTFTCEVKENISNTYFKYGDYKININCKIHRKKGVNPIYTANWNSTACRSACHHITVLVKQWWEFSYKWCPCVCNCGPHLSEYVCTDSRAFGSIEIFASCHCMYRTWNENRNQTNGKFKGHCMTPYTASPIGACTVRYKIWWQVIHCHTVQFNPQSVRDVWKWNRV